MRVHVAMLFAATLIAAGCGEEDQPRERANDEIPRKSTTIVEYPEVEGGWAFVEGYEVVVQFLGSDGWSRPKALAPEATARHRQHYGSAVRMTVCEGTCGDAADIVELPGAIRCQMRANQPRGSTAPLRITPLLVRDRDGDIGCEWTGSGIVENHCTPSDEFDGPVDRLRLVSPAELRIVKRFKFVERYGCVASYGEARFTKMGWEGSLDCNSAAGRWRLEPGLRVRFGTNSSTLIACSTPLAVNPEDIAYVERLPSGDVRLIDEHWFPLVVAAPVRDVPDAYGAPEGARIAITGTVIEHDDDARICTVTYASLPPSCGDVGGRAGFVGSTMRVESLELKDLEPKESNGVRWLEEATLVGRRADDTFTVE